MEGVSEWAEFKARANSTDARLTVEVHDQMLFVAARGSDDDNAAEWALGIKNLVPGSRLMCWGAGRVAALRLDPTRTLGTLDLFVPSE